MAVEALSIQNLNHTAPSAPSNDCVEMQGKTRVVERIQLSDPSSLEEEIEKFEPLKNRERSQQNLWGVAAVVAAVVAGLAIVILTTFLISSGVGLHLLYPAVYAFLFVVVPLAAQACRKGSEVEKMEECQKAMRDEQFRSFAVSHFGDSLEPDQLVKANQIFQSRTASMMEEGFIQFEKRFKHPLPVECFSLVHRSYLASQEIESTFW